MRADAPTPRSRDAGAPSRSSDQGRVIGAAVLGAVITAIWIWWPLEAGGFFPSVYLPGALLLYGALAVLLPSAPVPVSRSGPHVVALLALFGLVAWTGLSILWSPARDVALDDAQRTLIYPAAFAAGLWMSVLLGRRAILTLAPWGAASVAVASMALIKLFGIVDIDEAFINGTLEYPFEYRNATAAYFVLSAIVLVGLAARRRSPLALGGIAIGFAVVSLSLAILGQSRGSVLALGAGILGLLAFYPDRVRVLGAMLAAALPTALIGPKLLEPFAAASDEEPVVPVLEQVLAVLPIAAVGGGLLAVLIGWLARVYRARSEREPGEGSDPDTGRRTPTAIGVAVILVVGILLAGVGGAFDDASKELTRGFDRLADGGDTRFTYTGGNRADFYRVALEQLSSQPIKGEGSGSFRTSYAMERDSFELPRDAHSLELETLGELGLIGFALLMVAVGAAALAAWRSRKHGTDAAILTAVALAAGVAWFAQASLDWFTSIPGLTAPVIALLGAAAGPAARDERDAERRRWRILPLLVLILAAAIAIPTYLADRYTLRAAANWRADPAAAFAALDRAASLNPLADTPLQVEAQIARATNASDQALQALAEAKQRQPDEWRTYLLTATVYGSDDPAAARAELRRARELNPMSPEVSALKRKLSE